MNSFVHNLFLIMITTIPIARGQQSLCTADEQRQSTEAATRCAQTYATCTSGAVNNATARCDCFVASLECFKNIAVCVDVPTPRPTTAHDKMIAIDACTRATSCSAGTCQRIIDNNVNKSNWTDADFADACRSLECGSEHIKGGKDQFCFCVRDHIKCLDGHFGSLADKCDATNALEGTYADLCPDLCAALPRITPRPQVASGGGVSEGELLKRRVVLATVSLSLLLS